MASFAFGMAKDDYARRLEREKKLDDDTQIELIRELNRGNLAQAKRNNEAAAAAHEQKMQQSTPAGPTQDPGQKAAAGSNSKTQSNAVGGT